MHKGFNINLVNEEGDNLLSIIIKNGASIEKVNFLLNHGIEINKENREGLNPLITAIRSGAKLEIIHLLIERGANIKLTSSGLSPLTEADKVYDITVVEILLDKGSDINEEDSSGHTILTLRIKSSRNFHEILYLLDRGADVNKITRLDISPLSMAIKAGAELAIINLLVEKGADIRKKDSMGIAVIDLAEELSPAVRHALRWNSDRFSWIEAVVNATHKRHGTLRDAPEETTSPPPSPPVLESAGTATVRILEEHYAMGGMACAIL